MTLDECRENVGAGVVYDPGFPGARKEDGTIVDVGPVYPFILFRGDGTAKATPPENLSLLAPKGCTSRWTNSYGAFGCTQTQGHAGDHHDDRYGENVSVTWDTASADR